MVFGTDSRISFNREEKHSEVDPGARKVNRRVKERTSYQLAWMEIDLTVVEQTALGVAAPKSYEYEVELEIKDAKHLQNFVQDKT